VRVIVEIFGRTWMLSLSSVQVAVPGEENPEPEFDSVPVDPHGTLSCTAEHANQGSLEVQELSGAGVYPVPQAGRRFGFSGG
jgi:hypothetical protein